MAPRVSNGPLPITVSAQMTWSPAPIGPDWSGGRVIPGAGMRA
nr:MAG TPA: hypothetical protein [Caudoviricetes sp.]